MIHLFRNIRFYILLFSFLLSLGFFIFVEQTFSSEPLQKIRLTQLFGLSALAYLYLALLIGPVIRLFPFLPMKGHILKSRRALGVSSFFFGLLHACIAFFGQLGGFAGLGFLSERYLIAISFSFTALIILTMMAATSFDFMIAKLTPQRWKMLHRLVYFAGIFIMIHALMLGTHFHDLSAMIPQIIFIAVALLLLLEAFATDKLLQLKYPTLPRFGIATLVIISIFMSFFISTLWSSGEVPSLSIHPQHTAETAEQTNLSPHEQMGTKLPAIPGIDGDKTKRYSVNFLHDKIINPNQETGLTFQVFDATNGQPVIIYKKLHEKLMHLIIVDEGFKSFTHIHPEQEGNTFTIKHTFPQHGRYRIYTDFQPFGGIEQQFAFPLQVGESPQNTARPDTTNGPEQLTDRVNGYQIELQTHDTLSAEHMTMGEQLLTFNVTNEATGHAVTTLQPYLGAFGHLVMINTQTFEYLHVHPTMLVTATNQSTGPDIQFMPFGLYGAIKPGEYKVYLEIVPKQDIILGEFLVTVE